MPDPFLEEQRALVDAYDFREVHPHLRVGTASDRFAAWIGQVYAETWREHIQTRPKRVGGQTFEERLLPVESVAEYFAHFSVLEIDFTFYRPLLSPEGQAGPGVFVLQQYAEHAPEDALFLLKAPQQFFARTLRRGKGEQVSFEQNPSYLDSEAYLRQFHEPAVELLGERLAGVIFEQEYGRVEESPEPEAFVAELDRFFRDLPTEVQPHLEIRSPHLLTAPYFRWLEARGLGFVFSHWTWLPPLREQWQMCGGHFSAADGQVVARLTAPRGTKFDSSYARAYPFEQPVPEIESSPDAQRMVLDSVALLYQAERQDALLHLIINNRAYGNAPALARRIAHRVLDEEEKRAAG